jgi:rhodanese-related sulfurtransferase
VITQNQIQAIFKLYPQVLTMRDDIAYDANGNEVSYDKDAVQAYVDAHAYKDLRAAAYPSFAEQFDLLYHGGYDAWKAQIQAVKNKYPKE